MRALPGEGVARFRLAPSLPPALLVPGCEYRVAGMPYRGDRLTVSYTVTDTSVGLLIAVSAERPTRCSVLAEDGSRVHEATAPLSRHEFAGRNGALYEVTLAF